MAPRKRTSSRAGRIPEPLAPSATLAHLREGVWLLRQYLERGLLTLKVYSLGRDQAARSRRLAGYSWAQQGVNSMNRCLKLASDALASTSLTPPVASRRRTRTKR